MIELGDIHALLIINNGEIVNPLHEAEDHKFIYDDTFEGLDMRYGALKSVVKDPELNRQAAEDYFNQKFGPKKCGLLNLNPADNFFDKRVSAQDADKAGLIVEKCHSTVMATDGFTESPEQMPFFALLPSLSSVVSSKSGKHSEIIDFR